jgi:hypothetical protein
MKQLFQTQPHGAQLVFLVEDDERKPANRIYRIVGGPGEKLSILGSELESLTNWWRSERTRDARKT